jgi:hypothetical protein
MPRPICEAFRSIDVRWIYREGRKIFALSWSQAGEPFGQVYGLVVGDAIFFVFVAPSEGGSECSPVIKFVPITWTACHFGGRRPWFVCPHCGRRIAVIYIAGEYVAGRRCLGLVYASQQEPVSQRGLCKARKIRDRLGAAAYDVVKRNEPSFRADPTLFIVSVVSLRRSEAARNAANRPVYCSFMLGMVAPSIDRTIRPNPRLKPFAGFGFVGEHRVCKIALPSPMRAICVLCQDDNSPKAERNCITSPKPPTQLRSRPGRP